jgi:hypothetical protein
MWRPFLTRKHSYPWPTILHMCPARQCHPSAICRKEHNNSNGTWRGRIVAYLRRRGEVILTALWLFRDRLGHVRQGKRIWIFHRPASFPLRPFLIGISFESSPRSVPNRVVRTRVPYSLQGARERYGNCFKIFECQR